MTDEYKIANSWFQRVLLGLLSPFTWLRWWMVIPVVLAGWATCAHYHCTAHEKTLEILERDGYEVIEMGNRAWLSCESEAFSNTFVATKAGKTARGAVCCGFLKNCTVRWE